MPKHLAFALFLLSLLIEMNWREQTYNPLQQRHFYKRRGLYLSNIERTASQRDIHCRVGFFYGQP